MQLLVNTLYSFLMIGAVASSFFIVFKPSKYFHLSHAASIVLGAYIYLGLESLHYHPALAVFGAILGPTLVGVLSELLFYRSISSSRNAGIRILVLSLGIYIVIQNCISLAFGDQIRLLDPCNGCLRETVTGPRFVISTAQAVAASISTLLIALLLIVWYRTGFGTAARSVSENRDLSTVIGVNVNRTILLSIALGSAAAAIAGLLIGLETGVTPTIGFTYLLYGIIAMIVGGSESLAGALFGALVLAVLQNSTSYFVDSKWASTVSYAVLIGVLVLRPQGIRTLSMAVEQR